MFGICSATLRQELVMLRAVLLLAAFRRGFAATKLRVGLEWFLNPDHLPLVVALREGFFADAGLDVELVEPVDHWEAEEEIIAGRLDVAVTETLHLALDSARGKPVVGFSRFLHTDGGVMFLKGSISRPRDIPCNATISYPGYPGPGGPAIVRTMVEADGGECGDFKKFNGSFFHTDALASGNADLATLVFYNFEVVEARLRGLDADFFSLKDWGVPDFCQLVLFTTPEKLREMSSPLRQLVLAMRKATGLIQREPKRAAMHWRDHNKANKASAPLKERLNPLTLGKRRLESKIDAATFQATLPYFVNDNSLSSDYFDSLMAWLVKTGQVDAAAAADAPATNYWTNSLAL